MHKNCKKVFAFNEFCTRFSSVGDDNIDLGRRACFDMLVSQHRQPCTRRLKINDITTNTYKVFVSFVDLHNNWNNCCFLSKEELDEWIKDMQRFAEFEYNIEDFAKGCDSEFPYLDTGDAVYVNLVFKERPFAEHFLVLEMIKHAYEYAFSWSVYQAVKFRDIINKDELLINIHNLIFCCNWKLVCRSCYDHTILTTVYYDLNGIYTERDHYVCYLPAVEDIKERLSKTFSLSNVFNPVLMKNDEIGSTDLASLNYVCSDNSKCYEQDPRVKTTFEITKKIDYIASYPDDLKSIERYFKPELCKQRLDRYISTYEKLRKYGRQ